MKQPIQSQPAQSADSSGQPVVIVSYVRHVIYSQVQTVEGPVHADDSERCLFKSAEQPIQKTSANAGARQAKVIKSRAECIQYCEANGLSYRVGKMITM